MRYLLWLALVPGTIPLALLALRSLVRAVRKSRIDNEDAERALRIQRDYMIPDWAVEVSEPTGRRAKRNELPEIPSNYKEVGRWL